jgi:hypothetical protein
VPLSQAVGDSRCIAINRPETPPAPRSRAISLCLLWRAKTLPPVAVGIRWSSAGSIRGRRDGASVVRDAASIAYREYHHFSTHKR